VKAKGNASFRAVKLGASIRVAAAVATVAQSIPFVELLHEPNTHRLLLMQGKPRMVKNLKRFEKAWFPVS
jgi:hypothetical protein